MADSMKRNEFFRLTVRWPLKIKTESGEADGETRNITGEGMFLYCSQRLREGAVYQMRIKLPDRPLDLKGQLTWSNLVSCPSPGFNPAMGFYFIRIDEDKDRQSLREAIVKQHEKPVRPRRETGRDDNSRLSNEEQALGRSKGIAASLPLPRN